MPTNRDEEILKHIGRYGLTLRVVLEHMFFDGREKACDAVINRLVAAGLINSREGLPGGLNYYQICAAQARNQDVPENRCDPKKSRGVREALQVLWFCCMTKHNRLRVDGRQIHKQFGRGKGLGKPHCRETFGETRVLYRIYTPGPGSRDDYLIKVLRRDWAQVQQHPVLGEWSRAGSYRFAVLSEVSHRKEKLRQVAWGDDGPRPQIELVPGLTSLHRAVKEFKNTHPTAWYETKKRSIAQ